MFFTEDNYDRVINQGLRLIPLVNKKTQSVIQILIDGVRQAQEAKENDDLKTEGEVVNEAVPFVKKLIPLLPTARLREIYETFLKKLKSVAKKFNEGRGSFAAVKQLNEQFTQVVKHYLDKHLKLSRC